MNIYSNITRNVLFFLLIFLLLTSRFIHIGWGLPFPMHPDERNMVVAIMQLTCSSISSIDCFNPHFFAYGQLPLYVGFILAPFVSLIQNTATSFEQTALSLRILSAVASVLTVFVLIKTIKQLITISNKWVYLAFLFCTFVPAFIQFSHFGTTESVLMLCYALLLYLAVRLLTNTYSLPYFITYSAIIFGIALGTKVSALAFGAIPAFALLFYAIAQKKWNIWVQLLFEGAKFLILSAVIFLVTSPYNVIDFNAFIGSMSYESAVGFGEYKAFYTRSFEYSIPILFQIISIFPYSLGWPIFILFVLGFFLLPYNNSLFLFLRIQFLIFFIPNAFFYAKWTRFSSPIFPLMVLIAFITLIYSYKLIKRFTPLIFSKVIICIITCIAIVPGIAYTSIYLYPDVRYKASDWVYENMEDGAYILSETANVIDVPIIDPKNPHPISSKNFTYISFNFYDLHVNPELVSELEEHISKADYIFIPSRRVFANHTCYVPDSDFRFRILDFRPDYEVDRCEKLKQDYPQVNRYYDRLFSGELGFKQVAEFNSYPRIELFGITLWTFPDEFAEETWTVFDHPVMRIYKRVNN